MFSDSFITPSLSSSPSLSSLKIEEKKKRRKREKYMKITDEQRDQLLDLVFFQNEKVKKVKNVYALASVFNSFPIFFHF